MTARPGAATPRVIAALVSIYLIWGSTYVPIQWAVRVYPPFFLAGTRAVIAGVVLYLALRARGEGRPEPRLWWTAAVVGVMLLAGGNALVSWSSQWVPSGIVALLIALLPVWMVLFGYLHGTEKRATPAVWAGIVLGLAGVAVLIGPKLMGVIHGEHGAGSWGPRQVIGSLVVLLSSMSWANGSLFSRRMPQPRNALMGTAMQLLCGGVAAMLISLTLGEWGRLSPAAIRAHPDATWSLVYLTVLGTLVGYSVYIWLLHRSTPALVSTYAYVNPVIAVVLGCWLNREPLAPATVVGAAVIIAGVVVIVTFGQNGRRPAPTDADGRVGTAPSAPGQLDRADEVRD
jgi:drug/metabolite transporter (DMT)-like permease